MGFAQKVAQSYDKFLNYTNTALKLMFINLLTANKCAVACL